MRLLLPSANSFVPTNLIWKLGRKKLITQRLNHWSTRSVRFEIRFLLMSWCRIGMRWHLSCKSRVGKALCVSRLMSRAFAFMALGVVCMQCNVGHPTMVYYGYLALHCGLFAHIRLLVTC